jgi:hypothetical protein
VCDFVSQYKSNQGDSFSRENKESPKSLPIGFRTFHFLDVSSHIHSLILTTSTQIDEFEIERLLQMPTPLGTPCVKWASIPTWLVGAQRSVAAVSSDDGEHTKCIRHSLGSLLGELPCFFVGFKSKIFMRGKTIT